MLTIVGVLALLGGGGFMTAAHLEDSDAFCASCHSQPESTFYDRSQSATAVDLASQHHGESTKCIDCHSGPGVIGRASAIQLGAGDLIAFVTTTAKQPAPLTHPISDAACLKCHADTITTRNFNRHFHAFLPQWQALDKNAATCVDCHSAHTTDGDPSIMFLQKAHTEEVCQRCHTASGAGG